MCYYPPGIDLFRGNLRFPRKGSKTCTFPRVLLKRVPNEVRMDLFLVGIKARRKRCLRFRNGDLGIGIRVLGVRDNHDMSIIHVSILPVHL